MRVHLPWAVIGKDSNAVVYLDQELMPHSSKESHPTMETDNTRSLEELNINQEDLWIRAGKAYCECGQALDLALDLFAKHIAQRERDGEHDVAAIDNLVLIRNARDDYRDAFKAGALAAISELKDKADSG